MQASRRDADALKAELSAESVAMAKYRRMVGEIGRLIDWAQAASPLPLRSPAGTPTGALGGRPERLPLLAAAGSAPAALCSPLGEATNSLGPVWMRSPGGRLGSSSKAAAPPQLEGGPFGSGAAAAAAGPAGAGQEN